MAVLAIDQGEVHVQPVSTESLAWEQLMGMV